MALIVGTELENDIRDLATRIAIHMNNIDTDSAESLVRLMLSETWEQGYDAGHFLDGEKRECDCERENPYR